MTFRIDVESRRIDKVVKSFIKDNKNILITVGILVGIFLLYFLLMSAFKNSMNFIDEADNMLGAQVVSKGGLIYKDYISQHLPLMYYLIAPLVALGVTGTNALRLCFYLVLALIFVLIYARYSKKIGKIPMLLYGLFYIGMMATTSIVSFSIISEQIQAQCLVVLFLELYLFYKRGSLDRFSDLIIGLCVFGAIWSAFVSIIPVFIFAISFIIIDARKYVNANKKFLLKKYLREFFGKYHRVMIFVLVPFVLSLGYLAINGDLMNMFDQAFYLNTHYYSKFNGYSSNPIITLIKLVPDYASVYFSSAKALVSGHSLRSVFQLIYFMFNLCLVFYLFKKDKLFLALSILFILACGNRTFESFHAIPYYAVSIITFLVIFQTCQFHGKRYGVYACVLAGFIFIAGYAPYGLNILNGLKTSNDEYTNVLKITNKGDYVYSYNLDTPFYVNTGRKSPSSVTTLVPWFASLFEEQIIKELDANRPKVIIYNPDGDVWGYVYHDFAKELDSYIKRNYTYSSQMSLWVRNDYVKEAEKKANVDIADFTNSYDSNGALSAVTDNTEIVQRIKLSDSKLKAISLKIGTFQRVNYSLLELDLYDNSGNEVGSSVASDDSFVDNSFYRFNFSDLRVNSGEYYTLKVKAEHTNALDYVTLYKSDSKVDSNSGLAINGVEKTYSLGMDIYYN